jgi:hypothetical protein
MGAGAAAGGACITGAAAMGAVLDDSSTATSYVFPFTVTLNLFIVSPLYIKNFYFMPFIFVNLNGEK